MVAVAWTLSHANQAATIFKFFQILNVKQRGNISANRLKVLIRLPEGKKADAKSGYAKQFPQDMIEYKTIAVRFPKLIIKAFARATLWGCFITNNAQWSPPAVRLRS